jgi:hypothetical protein
MEFKSTKEVSSSRFVALIVGSSGIGKTSQVRFLPEDRTLIISAEAGLLCLKGTDFPVKEIKSTDDLMDIYNFLTKEPKLFDYIFIDSLTEIGEMVLTELKNDPKYADPKMALKMYGQYNDIMTKIVKVFRDLTDYSVIFTCLDEVVKNGVETMEEFNLPGSSVKSSIKAWFDLVLHLKAYKKEDGEQVRKFITDATESRLAKDRSGLLDSYEDADLSAIINKVLL